MLQDSKLNILIVNMEIVHLAHSSCVRRICEGKANDSCHIMTRIPLGESEILRGAIVAASEEIIHAIETEGTL